MVLIYEYTDDMRLRIINYFWGNFRFYIIIILIQNESANIWQHSFVYLQKEVS